MRKREVEDNINNLYRDVEELHRRIDEEVAQLRIRIDEAVRQMGSSYLEIDRKGAAQVASLWRSLNMLIDAVEALGAGGLREKIERLQ